MTNVLKELVNAYAEKRITGEGVQRSLPPLVTGAMGGSAERYKLDRQAKIIDSVVKKSANDPIRLARADGVNHSFANKAEALAELVTQLHVY